MMRMMKTAMSSARRLTLLLAATMAGFAVAVLTSSPPPPKAPSRAAVSACRDAPDADCLLAIGTALLAPDAMRAHAHWVSALDAAGRLDTAADLLIAAAVRDGATPEAALRQVRRDLAGRYLARELARGGTLGEAVASVPEVDGAALSFAARRIMGRPTDGWLGLLPPEDPDPEERETAAEIAQLFFAWAETDPARVRDHHAEDLVDLYVLLGDRDGAAAALGLARSRGRDLKSISDDAFRLLGPETVLADIDRSDPGNAILLERAGSAEPDDAKAAAYLSHAFAIHATRDLWPDHHDMLRVVRRARDRSLPAARSLAHRMADLAEHEGINPFRAFAHLDTAMALLETGAGEGEVRAQLGRARALFPSDPNARVAVGLVSGPMQWERFGLADEARGQSAAILLRLGDLDAAVAELAASREPLPVWLGLVRADLPVLLRDRLVAAAFLTLPEEEAQIFAARMLTWNIWAPWVQTTATRIASHTGGTEAWGADLALSLAQVGFRSASAGFGERALARAARAALDARDGRLIVKVGAMMASRP
jgi:hypothetical protein